MAATKVIVDTDPATCYPLADVDDGLALFYLLAYPREFKLLGITTVYGNASLPKTTSKAEEILRVARPRFLLESQTHRHNGRSARGARALSPGSQ